MKWQVSAEHTAGKSSAHCCSTGAYSDPCDLVDFEFEGDYGDAIGKGVVELERLRQEAIESPCACGKSKMASWYSWADSASVVVEPRDDEAAAQYAQEHDLEFEDVLADLPGNKSASQVLSFERPWGETLELYKARKARVESGLLSENARHKTHLKINRMLRQYPELAKF